MIEWKKVGTHAHHSADGRYMLVRRHVSMPGSAQRRAQGAHGGSMWQVFCRGHHENHKRCPTRPYVSEASFEAAKIAFETELARRKEAHAERDRAELDGT